MSDTPSVQDLQQSIFSPAAIDQSQRHPASQTPDIIPVWQLAQMQQLQPFIRQPVSQQRDDQDGPIRRGDSDFPVTTRLSGEAVFVLSRAAGGNQEESDESIETNLTLGGRVRLTFDTSFSGKDLLRLRLQTTNVAGLDDVFDTEMARLSIQGDDQNQFEISRLDYFFPIGERTEVSVKVVGGSLSDLTDPLNPLLSSSGRGSISRFGQRNPIYRQGGGVGLGVTHEFNDLASISIGYLADDPDALIEEESSAFAQLTFEPAEDVGLGLIYVRTFNSLDTGTGSELANDPFDGESDAIASNSFGLQATANIADQVTVSGWVGVAYATATDLPSRPQADILNWAVTLAFPDLLRESSVAGVVIGQPPRVIRNQLDLEDQRNTDEAASLHLEAFYRVQIDDHISVTPGVLIVTRPEFSSDQNPIFIGTIRTTFRF